MAEKKVSTKNKINSIPERDSSYDDFIAEYGSRLRRRTTKTVAEPVKRKDSENPEESRCGEIDPHMTVNPAAVHQISTKRTSRMLSDDSGFKALSYNQRFELTPEMPETEESNEAEELALNSLPGQQTMADLIEANGLQDICIPVEGQIDDEDSDPFTAAYRDFRSQSPLAFGKSEKLRAIARTAADDAGMEPDSQLSFPAFDPLFKFPEEQPPKKKLKKSSKKNRKKTDIAQQAQQAFDIEEKDIVTSHQPEEANEADKEEKSKPEKQNKFFDFLTDKEFQQDIEPPVEINSKNEIHSVLKTLTSHGRTALIKTGALFVLGLILFIVVSAADKSNVTLTSTVSLVFLVLSCILCIKELIEGIKDILKKRLTLSTVSVLLVVPALVQIIVSLITKSSEMQLLTPSAILSLTAVTAPVLLLTNNAKLTAGMFASGSVSILKKASDGGIDGVVKEKFAGEGGQLRYSSKTHFATGLIKKLTNAVPRAFGANAVYFIFFVLALIAGIASSFISSDASVGAAAFCSMLITCIPATYAFTAALFLYNTNNDLAKKNASLISYRCAAELTETKAVVFNASEIIEQSACSIHGVKAFGHTDPQKASLCCAAAINAGHSPLMNIMKQITDQSEIEVPEAESFEIFSSGGIRAQVEGSDVLLGSRDFLEDNGVYIPKENYEEKFLTGDRKLLYLATDGRFSMLLIVSYHIKRSVAAFFKNLVSNGIKIVIHSSDPNITPEYITKKCKLPKGFVFKTGPAEASYFMDKDTRTEAALPADVFTDGSVGSVAYLFRKAFKLSKAIYILPFVNYIMSALCALLIICPLFLGSAAILGNLYIIILKAVSFVTAVVTLLLLSKKQEEK